MRYNFRRRVLVVDGKSQRIMTNWQKIIFWQSSINVTDRQMKASRSLQDSTDACIKKERVLLWRFAALQKRVEQDLTACAVITGG